MFASFLIISIIDLDFALSNLVFLPVVLALMWIVVVIQRFVENTLRNRSEMFRKRFYLFRHGMNILAIYALAFEIGLTSEYFDFGLAVFLIAYASLIALEKGMSLVLRSNTPKNS